MRSFNDDILNEKIIIQKFDKLGVDMLDKISNVKVVIEKDETYEEPKNSNSTNAFKHLNEVFINTLPYGDILKPFFKTDAITPTDLKIFLAKKGIYLKSSNKKKIINLMTTLLFSSNELEEFKSLIDVKDRTVHTTEEFLHVKQDQSLKEVFNKAQINLDNITDELNTKIINTESMFFKQSDHDKNEYTLSLITEVKDPTSSLSVNTIWGKSEVIVKKVDNKVVIVSINSITRDDKHIANRIVKTLSEEFQRINFIKDERIKVLFKNFKSNAERVNYLLSFSNCSSSRILKSAVIQSIKFKFDNNAEIPKRYKDKADTDSIINYSDGKHLHTLDELSNESAKDSILLEEIEISYKFELHNIKNGKYKVTYNFSDALKNKDEYNGVFKSNPVLTMRKSIKGMKDIEKLKQELSKEIDRLKLEKIQLFKII